MAQKQWLMEVQADFEQTIVNKVIDQPVQQVTQGFCQNSRTTLWTLTIYNILHCVDRLTILNTLNSKDRTKLHCRTCVVD